jgi:hypothetical protein
MAVGATACFVAWKLANPGHRNSFVLWQALGIADLVRGGGRPKNKLLDKICVLYALSFPTLTNRNKQNKANLYNHLRPDFMQSEFDRVPDYTPNFGTKDVEFDPVDPRAVAAA